MLEIIKNIFTIENLIAPSIIFVSVFTGLMLYWYLTVDPKESDDD